MDARLDKRFGAKLLIGVSLVALIAALVFAFWPSASIPTMIDAKKRQVDKLKSDTASVTAKRDELRARNETRLWNKPSQDVGPSALDAITRLVKSRRLKLATFRPQKPVELEGVTELPFLFAVEGSYPELIALVRDMEKPERKLALTMLQFSAADGATDRVTATMSIAAFTKSAVKGGSDGKAL